MKTPVEIPAAYSIDCTGDACTGDHVAFEKAVFTGSYKKPRYSHSELVTGEIVNDSYGAAKQQHTFTLLHSDGSKSTVKGRNLYRNGTRRKPWQDEAARTAALNEKHGRGYAARELRQQIREEQHGCIF